MYDELELDLVGDRKTALFFIISDTDATFNFLVSMAYTQLFNLLCERADDNMVAAFRYMCAVSLTKRQISGKFQIWKS